MTALDAAIAAHMTHPAGSQFDGLTNSLCDQAGNVCMDSCRPDFVNTVATLPPDEQATMAAAVQAAAQKFYVLGVREGRLAGFAWGLALGCALVAVAMRFGYAAGTGV